MRLGTQAVVGGIVAAVIAGCGLLGSAPPVSPPAAGPSVLDDDDHLAWAENEPYTIVVRRSCRTLDVYRQGYRVRSFPAVFGLAGSGSKLYEGDLRTPTGLYMIVDKRPHPRWRHFLLLDYPNLEDVHRYWLAMDSGRIPWRGERYAGVGGAVGIHGTDKPSMNERGLDWTFGCISLRNEDVEELAVLVPVGTLVLIED
jgi:murein L,D-transpeptidase YafK